MSWGWERRSAMKTTVILVLLVHLLSFGLFQNLTATNVYQKFATFSVQETIDSNPHSSKKGILETTNPTGLSKITNSSRENVIVQPPLVHHSTVTHLPLSPFPGSKSDDSKQEVGYSLANDQPNNVTGRNDGTALPNATIPNNSPEALMSDISDLQTSRSITMVVGLSGEMGNHLQKIAFARALQNMLYERYSIRTELIMQHQERGGKWISAAQNLKECFPNLRHYDFERGNAPSFYQRLQQQNEWLGRDEASKLVFPNLVSQERVDEGLEFLSSLVRKNSTIPIDDHNISLPFLYVQAFAELSHIDSHFSDLRQLFSLDRASCCKELPQPDESVFHFRNYLAEMPRKGKKKGYEELSPNQTTHELFRHLSPGSKVAITSRQHNPAAQAYVDALQERGLKVRIIANQSSVQDFCFLASSQKELGGSAMSTFLVWAATLGNATVNWLYSIDSDDTRRVRGDEALIDYRWSNPQLQRRLRFVHFLVGNETNLS